MSKIGDRNARRVLLLQSSSSDDDDDDGTANASLDDIENAVNAQLLRRSPRRSSRHLNVTSDRKPPVSNLAALKAKVVSYFVC